MGRGLKFATAAVLVVAAGLAATWTVRRIPSESRALAVTGTIEATQVDVSAKITGRDHEDRGGGELQPAAHQG